MPNILLWLFIIVSGLVCLPYIVGPILVYRSQKMPTTYKFVPLELQAFLEKRGEIFRQLHDEITANGFSYIGSAELGMSHSAMYFSIFYSADKAITCTLLSAEARNIGTSTQIEFTQMYTDGTLLSVNNNVTFGVFPEWKIKQCFRFPHINNFSQLLEIAERLMHKYKVGIPVKPMPTGEEFAIIEAHLNEEMHQLIERGWVSAQASADGRQLTLKGAILMTWKMCWPLKQIIDKNDIARSMKAL